MTGARTAAILFALAATAATGQPPVARDGASSRDPQPGYSAKISAARLRGVSVLPDWSGVWHVLGSPALISTEHDVAYRAGNRNKAPYKPDWQARYDAEAARAERQGVAGVTDALTDSHTIYCAAGVPRDVATPLEYQFFVAPERTVINIGGEVRQVYTDGRAFPADDSIWPRFWGWSIGHWQGDFLTIETRSMKPEMWLDPTPMKLSGKAVMTERLRRISPRVIENQVTIVDPVAFTAPWHFVRYYERLADQAAWMDEKEVCGGPEDRNPIVDGHVTVSLPPQNK